MRLPWVLAGATTYNVRVIKCGSLQMPNQTKVCRHDTASCNAASALGRVLKLPQNN